MGPPAGVSYAALAAACLLIPVYNAVADEAPGRLPTVGVMGDSEPIGLPVQGPAGNVTQLAVSA